MIWKLAVISEGNQVPGEQEFDLCFGGRRQFCKTEYADLGKEIVAVFFKSKCQHSFSGSFHMDNILLAIDSTLTLSKATALNYALEALHRILSEIKALLFVHLICFHEVIQLFSF